MKNMAISDEYVERLDARNKVVLFLIGACIAIGAVGGVYLFSLAVKTWMVNV